MSQDRLTPTATRRKCSMTQISPLATAKDQEAEVLTGASDLKDLPGVVYNQRGVPVSARFQRARRRPPPWRSLLARSRDVGRGGPRVRGGGHQGVAQGPAVVCGTSARLGVPVQASTSEPRGQRAGAHASPTSAPRDVRVTATQPWAGCVRSRVMAFP